MADFCFLEVKMNVKILKLIEKNARMTVSDIATAIGISESEAAREIG